MGNRPFSKPIFLTLSNTGDFQARTPWDALEYLDRYWSEAKTAHYRRARALCQSAVEGIADSESARLAVLDAAQRAHLLVHNRDRSSPRALFRANPQYAGVT